jgi:outer membrane lipoprotein carrier protein
MRALLVTLFAFSTAAAQEQSADAILDKASNAYTQVKTLRASFTQTINNPLTGTTATSTGEAQQRIPGYIDVRFTDPAGDRIVADGKWLWLYLPSTNPGQVIRTPVNNSANGVTDFLGQLLNNPRSRFTPSDSRAATSDGRPAHVITLAPKDASLPFTKAMIWVDDADGLVRTFETVDQSGVVRHVAISKMQVNPKVDPKAFTFVVPKGTKVVEGGS